jgi:integrase
MGLGTKNRQKQTADICKQHLREKYRDKLGLVEEFIVEGRTAEARQFIEKGLAMPDVEKDDPENYPYLRAAYRALWVGEITAHGLRHSAATSR